MPKPRSVRPSRRGVLAAAAAASAMLAAPALVRAQANALKIAVLLPRSGYLAPSGQSCHRGAVAQAAGTLSGGEQQMLAIGRCLMGAPELVMFDEPSLGLAPAVVQDVLRTIRELNREGLTCLLVEQNVAVSLKLARRAYVLENGRITLSGSGAELLDDDRVRRAYLGM
jgi:ABC-type histidine transport system ATPase subunit